MAVNGVYLYVSPYDRAIDAPAEDEKRVGELVALLREINDGKRLASEMPVREGRRLTLFQVRRLTRRGYSDLTRIAGAEAFRALQPAGDLSTLGSRAVFPEHEDAVRRGLVDVEGLELNGSPLKLETEDTSGGQTVLKRESLDQVFEAVGARIFDGLGARILELTKLGPR